MTLEKWMSRYPDINPRGITVKHLHLSADTAVILSVGWYGVTKVARVFPKIGRQACHPLDWLEVQDDR